MSPEPLLPEQIRTARKSLGLSQGKLAELFNVTQTTISNWETGKSSLSDAQVAALHEYFGKTEPEASRDLSSSPQAKYGDWLSATRNAKNLTRPHAIERNFKLLPSGCSGIVRTHDDDEVPEEPGVYVLYDVSDRPVYVGESRNIRSRIKGHQDKFWFKSPIVEKASYVRVDEQKLRRQLEDTMIKFLKSNAVINQRQVVR